MYRVGGMYVNVDLFIKQKALQFRIPWGLCRVISPYFYLIARYGCATLNRCVKSEQKSVNL